eukprot:TRINITY_DN3038_c1_g1_i1.p2 TRINITY_DN3038_c1_g1~~TRINITY_DN3038_c1_g1_i1.p2  ORF type:complete len:119 (-),score=31.81 TRINITY_DN3038_c1_g1_i1:450-806(-)
MQDEYIQSLMMEIEAIAEDILTYKQQLIDMDKKYHKNREALRQQMRDTSGKDHSWMIAGSFFIKRPNATITSILKNEQESILQEKERIRDIVREKTILLHELEGRSAEVAGFNLNPVS